MFTISLCMIVRDEEGTLRRCLDSVKEVVDEIIIVDTGSRDHTAEIAREFTEKVYEFQWIDDFSAARNYGLERATQDYCMWLDADDVLKPEEAEKIQRLKEEMPVDVDVVMMKYAIAFDEWDRPTFTYYRERLVRNGDRCRFAGRVHEAITPFGTVKYEEIYVEHRKVKASDSNRNLRIYERMVREGEILGPRETYYYGRELYDHGRWRKAGRMLREFLKMPSGWEEDKKEACRLLAVCYYKQGHREKGLHSLLRGLAYGAPRQELCCDLGGWFLEEQMWETAVYWYEQALQAPRPEKGFCRENSRGYLPCLQLCVCWYRLGNYDKALYYHKEAGRWNPRGKEYLRNVPFFENLAYCK